MLEGKNNLKGNDQRCHKGLPKQTLLTLYPKCDKTLPASWTDRDETFDAIVMVAPTSTLKDRRAGDLEHDERR